MSECLRLIVYFLWHYDTAAVTFHSPLSCVQPLAPSINLFISAINWNAGVKKGKDGETKRNASSRYFLLRLTFCIGEYFSSFRSSSFTFCIASTDKHFPALKIISHQEKGFKRKFLTSFYPILIFFNMMSMHF